MESAGNILVSRLPEHPNVLRECVLRPGVTYSRLMDETLWTYSRDHMMSPVGLEIVLTCLAKVLRHLHDHNTGHFDVKPSNVLLKWVHTRGVFNKANVVLGDFGLAKQFTNGLYIYIYIQRHAKVTSVQTC